MMKGNLKETKKSLELAKLLMERLEDELNKVQSYEKGYDKGEIKCAYNGEYSLERIKRYCTEIRKLTLDIKKNVTERYENE